jgi:hypothetical protein
MKQAVLIGLFALCIAGCATDDSKYVQAPAPPTERVAPATPSAPANAPSSPSDAALEKKQTPDGQAKSASTAPQGPGAVQTVRPSPIKKDTAPTATVPPKTPSPANTVSTASPKKPTENSSEVPTLTLVHAANLQGEIEPCG